MSDSPDGTLHDWSDLQGLGWGALLVGNGLSVNISRDFAYESLYEEADQSSVDGSLTDDDRAVFEGFETTNFELVLAKLRDSIQMAEILGRDPRPYRRRYRSVQTALGTAVRGVHLEYVEVPDTTLAAIQKELREYDAIFSTSYDLLIYWAIGYGEKYGRFCDCFWSSGNRFDPDDAEVWGNGRPVYYMHGALHLIVEGSGRTRKLTQDARTLLDQFGAPIEGDEEARPLLISEGSARDKLRAIEGNDYLAHIYETFSDRDGPLLVFGHALGAQDRHLIDAINTHPDRPVAFSMVKKSKGKLREQQSEVWGKLSTEEIYYFDAATHPLGSPDLRREGPRLRFAPWASDVARAIGRE